LKSGKDELAGVLLAFTTIKPQVVVLLVLFILIWAGSTRRWSVIFWFMVSITFLTLAGMAFLPDWPIQNLQEVLRYPEYNPPGTPSAAFSQWWPGIGARLGWGLTILMAALLLVEWWHARNKGFRWFLWTACLTLVASQWIGIQTDPGNFVVLFIPMLLVLASWEERWGPRGRPVIVLLLLVAFFSLWGLFLYTVDLEAGAQQHPIMFFPLPAFLLVGLYWVRWWAIKPNRFLIDALRSYESS
ncbi:MAG: glycosyltransferase 87 family protein, partial [Anaerolineales bacterium]